MHQSSNTVLLFRYLLFPIVVVGVLVINIAIWSKGGDVERLALNSFFYIYFILVAGFMIWKLRTFTATADKIILTGKFEKDIVVEYADILWVCQTIVYTKFLLMYYKNRETGKNKLVITMVDTEMYDFETEVKLTKFIKERMKQVNPHYYKERGDFFRIMPWIVLIVSALIWLTVWISMLIDAGLV